LHDLVLQGSDAQRALSPVGLRDVLAARGSRSIGATVNTLVQVCESALPVNLVLVPSHTVDAGCRIPF